MSWAYVTIPLFSYFHSLVSSLTLFFTVIHFVDALFSTSLALFHYHSYGWLYSDCEEFPVCRLGSAIDGNIGL